MASSKGTIKYQSIVTTVNGKKVVQQVPVSGFATTQTYNAIGIDKAGVEPIKRAINDYKSKVQSAVVRLTQVEQTNSGILNHAMKGKDVQVQFKNAETAVREKAKSVIKQLDQFRTEIETIFKSYDTKSQAKATESFKIK